MKNKPLCLKRPIMHGIIGMTIGLIGGNMFLEQKHVSLIFIGVVIGYLMVYGYFYSFKIAMVIGSCVLIGGIYFCQAPVQTEVKLFVPQSLIEVEGKICDIQMRPYGQYITLEQVKYKNDQNTKVMSCKVQLIMNVQEELTLNDSIIIKGKIQEPQVKMNPSDFDSVLYLKAQNVVATIKVENLVSIKVNNTWMEKIYTHLVSKVNALFLLEDQGIMNALLLGNNSFLETTTDSLFTESGIGHVLCISGFHVSVMVGAFLIVLGQCRLSYTWRYIIALIGIWFYAILTGLGVSTLRATIMTTILIIGRCIGEEEDPWTNIAIAAFCVLMLAPYQLFQAGFQLSFGAVIAIWGGQILTQKIASKKKLSKFHNMVLTWFVIQLITTPILAYHFYEVPFLCSLLNWIAIPFFSLIMILGWCTLIMGLLSMPLACYLAIIINSLLRIMTYLITYALKMPLSTVCIGRPSIVELLLYMTLICIIFMFLLDYPSRQRLYLSFICMLSVSVIAMQFLPTELQITFLYVGQGDGTVILTPSHQAVVIDGGKAGKGKVIEKYLKYNGERHIDVMIVSHSDEDHIGGLLELLDTSITVDRVLVSQADNSELMGELQVKCKDKQISLYKIGKGNKVSIGELTFECMAPDFHISEDNNNDNSLVCKLTYKSFSALFTGDKHKNSEPEIYEEIGHVNLLKLSHHGSRTGTSEEVVLKLMPNYAIMSCGVNNRYGHPHEEVLALLEAYQVPYSRTDKQGAIEFETNGYELKINKQREEE